MIYNITEIIKQNEQLKKDNEILRKCVLSKLLTWNTEITRLNFRIEQLENEVKLLKHKNACLTLFVR